MKNYLVLLLSMVMGTAAYSQVANDVCATATDLGTLPSPSACPTGGSGSTYTYNGTTINAVAENPYSSLACMDAPAADVWVSFTASGNELDVNFSSSLNDANFGIYTGTCGNLTGLFCEASNNGNINTTLSPLVPGTTYYMQISGVDDTDFEDFTLELTSINNCNICLLAANVTANPAPTNGYYLPGTTVEFCVTVTEYDQIASNWMSGVEPILGPGWDASTLTGTSAPNGSGNYVWVFDDGPGGMGMGWYVDVDPNGPTGPDGDYSNNFGDPSISGTNLNEVFCFSVTTAGCTPGADLGIIFETYSDFETGGYGSPGCTNDPTIPFVAAMICCDVPLTTFINESCPGAADGSATAEGQGGIAPYDYVWEDANGTVVYTDNNNSGISTATGLTAGTYTVTVTDDLGCEQIIDITLVSGGCPTPTFNPEPADVAVQCAAPAMTNLTWNDPCAGTGSVAGVDVSNGQSCPETITRTWTYMNPCGNSVSATQIITIDDTQAPVFSAPPSAANVQCSANVPAMTNLGWTDNCDGTGNVAGNDVSDGQSCPETITRTWTYTDACGNVATETQTITVNDTQAPVFNAPPSTSNVQCSADVPAMTNLGWTDNCDGTGNVAGSDVSDGQTCPETITRTWTYTDACGNAATETQTITINDTQAPVFNAPPATANVQCSGDVPAMTNLGWTDNCDGAGNVAGSDVSDGQTCPETITRTWTYTDACGNIATETQTITVNDTQAPVFSAPPAAANYQCSGDVPAIANLGWTDNCDGTGNVAGSEVSDGQTCPETITRTWTYTDGCGNVATETQTITVNDTQAPVFSAPPAAANVQCSGDVPAMINLGWTDNCDGTGNVAGSDVSDGQSCPETITRTWTFTDVCGNIATETQTITVNDTQAPVFSTPPATANVQCSADVPAMINLGWTDNCDGSGDVVGSDVSDGQTCPETITRTWTFTDACGNIATETQTIIVDDTTPPTASNPGPISIAGGTPLPNPDPLVVTNEADNCTVNPVVAFVSDVSDNGNCPENITRTYSITDDCGNVALVTQIISIGDAVLPTASNPAPMFEQCIGDVPAPNPLVVIDEADNGAIPTVTFESESSNGQSCPETITRTYRVTDDCGNFILVTQTITVNDTQAPVLNAAPAAANVQCSADVPAMVDLGWTDNCDGTGNVTGSDVSDGQSCPETITRTWTYTDACGNVATETQTITVNDTQAPVFSAPPVAVNVQCSADVPAIVDLGWTDNCDGAGTVAGSEVSDGQSCPEVITRTWTYTDACGNIATETQTITVNDTQAPVFSAPPVAANVQCSGDVPAMADLAWTDNCDGAGMVTGSDVSDGQSCPEVITRTWTYTDACGNIATETQTITVNDTQAPIFSAPPAGVTVECSGDVPAVTNLAWTDNCDGAGMVTGSDVSDGQSCPETITRTWTYTDACGNIATETQTIIVDDTTPPTASNPTTTVVPGGPAPAVDVTVVNDEADNCTVNPVVTFVSEVSDNNPCPETITRIYEITDDCGNTTQVTHLIQITDPILPTGTAPADTTVECIGDVPAANPLLITDEADNQGVPTVAHVGDVSDGQSCPETITRTYSITDACANVVLVDQIITVIDTQAPVLNAAPAAANVQCSADVPAMVDLGWTDNCDGAGNVTGSDVSDGQSCPETITRTWTYTDACGNVATETQTITVNDTQAPVFSAPPVAVNVQCSADVPAIVDLGWTDNCDGAGTVAGSEVSDGQSCPEVITRTWTYTDACGNIATETQTITVNDTQAPVFSAPPVAANVQCSGDVPAMADLAWTDNCDGAGMVTGSDVSDGQSCPEVITRTWTYTDACGNIATETQTITVNDTQAPIFSAPPAGVTVECSGDVPAVTNLAWTDNCDGAGMVTGSDVSDGQSCPETITRTWTYTDACGNIATETQTIIVDDTTPPTASNPTTTVVPGGPAPAVDVTVVNDEADNCTVNPVVTFVSEVSDNNPCPETITRIYEITDDCGNTTQVTHLIQITDPILPTGTAPADTTVECIGDVPAANPLLITDEADNQGVPTVAHVGDVSDGQSCPETITRTYSITDACGNVVLVDQIITVIDTQAPVLNAAPAAANVQCSADVPAMVDLGWTDNCDGAGNVTGSDVSDGQSCPETITRTWTYTDACGNVATETQTITVNDTQAPVFSAPPVAVNVQCSADVPAIVDLGWTDNCDGAGTVAGSEVSDGQSCPEVITRTWTYTDACGNIATETQTITVNDTQAPVFSAPPVAANVQCSGDVPAMADLAWTDNCDGAGMVTGSDVSDGQSCPEVITRTWTYTDACGNIATETQTITVNDTQAPIFSAPPAGVTVECSGDVPAVTNLAWTDNCDGAGMVTGSDVSDGQSCPETITRTWTYTDACGNIATETQTIIVDDTTPPTASNPTTTVVPGGPAPAVDVTVVNDEADNCTVNPVVTFVSEVSDNNPCPETITRIYEITDDCGNTTQVTHLIQITDPILPTGTAPADTTVECIGYVPAANPLLITDEADNQGVPTVAHVGDVSDGQSCPETITRTYSITDICGNQITVDQIITVIDTQVPVLNATPLDVTVECIGDVPVMINLGWTDNCDGAGSVAGSEVSDGQSCPETITRTWTYTDACGNMATTSQVITVIDTQAPVFSAPPVATSVQCSGDVPAMMNLAWTDNCDGAGSVAGNDVSDGLSCPETITRTWTYTDACGNAASETQVITVHDTQAPVFNPSPANVTVQCSSDVPAMVNLDWTDNCDGAGAVAGNDVSDGLSCPETITRTWTFTDACGNTSTEAQTIIVDDTTPPTASNPAPISVPGANDVPAPDPLIVIDELDNCTANPIVTFVSEVSDGNVCNGEIITHTYSITDDCGNETIVTHEITILAVPAPIDAGPDQTICLGDMVTISATNPLNAQLTWSPLVPNGPFSPAQTTTYTVTADNEGCISSDQITITVEEPPVASFFGDVLSGCAPLTVNFTNTSTATSGIADCEWIINGQTISGCNPSYTFMNGGLYDVTLTTTSNTGCTSTVTYTDYIYVEDAPQAAFTPSQTELSTLFTEVLFDNNSTGATSYEWYFGDNSGVDTDVNPTHTFPEGQPGGYSVVLYAYSDLGCVDSARVTIRVNEELIYYVPNTFTPDGDDYNDVFLPVFTEGYDVFDYHLTIFNRWGETVFESYDATVGWDATYGLYGREVQDGTYVWKIEFKTTMNDERKMISGHVNVLK